jgi:hypothetical protein
LKLGWSNVDAMLRTMTAKQFQEWEVFYGLEPFGEDRRDQQLGRLLQLLSNVYRNTATRPTRIRIDECIPPPVGDLFFPSTGSGARTDWRVMQGVARMMTASGPWERSPGRKSVRKGKGKGK